MEVARQQYEELVVVVLSEDLSSLNLSLGDVAHAALRSRVLAAWGSFGAVAGFCASYSMAAANHNSCRRMFSQLLLSPERAMFENLLRE